MKNFKCASSSVEAFFGKFCIDPQEIPNYRFSDMQDSQITRFGILGTKLFKPGKWQPHIRAVEIKQNLGDEIFKSYFKFCVVRNPFDKIVSAYFFSGIGTGVDFKRFCKEYNKAGTVLDDADRIWLDGVLVCDFYIRFENLVEDIKTVCEKLGITDYKMEDLPNHKAQKRQPKLPYQSYYDDETREIIAEKFKREIEHFGYKF